MDRKALTSMLAGLVLAMSFAVIEAREASKAHGNLASTAVRLINTAEAYARRTNARYVSLADLAATGSLKQAADMNEDLASTYAELNLQNRTNLLNGFDFGLVVSSDGGAYKLSLSEKQSCGSAYFSDESGIIYTGRALGCHSK